MRLLPGAVPLEVVRGEPFAVVASFVDAAGAALPLTGTYAAVLLGRDLSVLAGGTMTVDATAASSGVLTISATAAASAVLVDSLHRWRLVDTASGHTLLDGSVRPRPSGAAGVPVGSHQVTATVTVDAAEVTVTVLTTGSAGGGGGGADLSDDTPAALGTAAAGVGTEASRSDHVHAMPSAVDVGALSSTSGYNTPGGWLKLDGSGTAPDSTLPASIARDSEVAGAVAAHVAATDPHGDRAYADDLLDGLAPVATSGAYSDLSGRPTLGTAAAAAVGDFDAAGAAAGAVAAIPADGSAATPSLRTLGTGAAQAAAGNDARLSDARTPAAHAASHADGGSDEVTLAQSQVTGLVADLAGKVPVAQPINAQTGTTYTLVAGDAGKLVTLDNAAAITLTVPQDSDATIPVGTYVDVMQLGAGQVTVVAGSGATLRVSGATAKARAQYSRLGVQKIAADTWSVFGDLAAS